ncbi:hypothetical protein ACSQ67_025336 [Phaseolus vulgaris]
MSSIAFGSRHHVIVISLQLFSKMFNQSQKQSVARKFKVSFVEEGCLPDIAFKNLFGKWDGGVRGGGRGRVGVVGGGRADVAGEGRVGNKELVQGRLESIPLGLVGTNSQEQLNGSLNVNGSLGYSKVENVKPTFNAEPPIPNKTKSTNERGGRSIEAMNVCIDEREIRSKDVELNGSFSERAGMGFHVEGITLGNTQAMGPLLILRVL